MLCYAATKVDPSISDDLSDTWAVDADAERVDAGYIRPRMEVLLLLGGNRGEVGATLARAEALLAERIGRVRARSRDHWTEPWGFEDDHLFLNRAILIDTVLDPQQVLSHCLRIEVELGRKRAPGSAYTSRTIDIDLLLFEDRIINLPDLRLPHPRMHLRAFALAPAADLLPDRQHPILHRTLLTLLNDVLRST